jgi:hypothetical protein
VNPVYRLRQNLADWDCESSMASRARNRRWAQLIERFPEIEDMNVVDLGGTPEAWKVAPRHPRRLTLINVSEQTVAEPWITVVGADACNPPPELAGAGFDLVYSNSVLEHLGGHARRAEFAEVVHRLAPHHWVQTPNRYFPVEPHFLFPGFQFLPVRARSMISDRWPLGWYSEPGSRVEERVETVLEIELIGATEMRHYFPTSELLRERWLGLTKSLVAVR